MFDVNLECGIRKVGVKVTADIARALGPDALNALEGLRCLAFEKVVLPIDAIAAHGAFTSGDGEVVEVGTMLGVKATATKPKDDGAGATIQIELDFAWQEDAWTFLGRNCAAVADVVLTKRQLELVARSPQDSAPN